MVTVALAASFSCGGSGSQTFLAEFVDVGDLVGRANVQQSDAVIGTVKAIDLVQRGNRDIARVTLRVNPETKVDAGHDGDRPVDVAPR